MSAQSRIVDALVEKIKEINGTGNYQTDLATNCKAKNVFWNECKDFPSVFLVTGAETREYLPGGFKWGHLGVSIKVYVKNGDDPSTLLEKLISDIELVINANPVLTYDTGKQTTEIRVMSIITDEGLLIPYGIGEVNLSIQYQVL